MKPEDALKMTELCIESINDEDTLAWLTDFIIKKRINLAIPKKRTYNKKPEFAEVGE